MCGCRVARGLAPAARQPPPSHLEDPREAEAGLGALIGLGRRRRQLFAMTGRSARQPRGRQTAERAQRPGGSNRPSVSLCTLSSCSCKSSGSCLDELGGQQSPRGELRAALGGVPPLRRPRCAGPGSVASTVREPLTLDGWLGHGCECSGAQQGHSGLTMACHSTATASRAQAVNAHPGCATGPSAVLCSGSECA